jgi:ubiquitin C-terminal hydrolase
LFEEEVMAGLTAKEKKAMKEETEEMRLKKANEIAISDLTSRRGGRSRTTSFASSSLVSGSATAATAAAAAGSPASSSAAGVIGGSGESSSHNDSSTPRPWKEAGESEETDDDGYGEVCGEAGQAGGKEDEHSAREKQERAKAHEAQEAKQAACEAKEAAREAKEEAKLAKETKERQAVRIKNLQRQSEEERQGDVGSAYDKVKSKANRKCNKGGISLCLEMHNLLRVTWAADWAVVTPHALVLAIWRFVPRFACYQQQDAQEFYTHLVEELQKEMGKAVTRNGSEAKVAVEREQAAAGGTAVAAKSKPAKSTKPRRPNSLVIDSLPSLTPSKSTGAVAGCTDESNGLITDGSSNGSSVEGSNGSFATSRTLITHACNPSSNPTNPTPFHPSSLSSIDLDAGNRGRTPGVTGADGTSPGPAFWQMIGQKTPQQLLKFIFQGEMVSEITCGACQKVSGRKEDFLCLSLDLPVVVQEEEAKSSGEKAKGGGGKAKGGGGACNLKSKNRGRAGSASGAGGRGRGARGGRGNSGRGRGRAGVRGAKEGGEDEDDEEEDGEEDEEDEAMSRKRKKGGDSDDDKGKGKKGGGKQGKQGGEDEEDEDSDDNEDKEQSISLQSCLERFTAAESLVESNQYHCEHCERKQDSEKALSVSLLPEVLVLHVNRARWLLHGAKEKLQNHVSFPLRDFDMRPYCSKVLLDTGARTTYALCAVVNHHGRGIDMGHYTAHCYEPERGGTWTKIDDTKITPVTEQEVQHSQAYLLFYERQRP